MSQLIAILLGVTTVLGFLFQIAGLIAERRRKTLDWELRDSYGLASLVRSHSNRLDVLYNGKSVSQVQVLILNIVNTGRATVASEDFLDPVLVKLTNSSSRPSRIVEVSYRPVESRQSRKTEITVDGGQLLLSPSLLRGEEVSLQILVDDYADATVSARIRDQTRPMVRIQDRDAMPVLSWVTDLVDRSRSLIPVVVVFTVAAFATENNALVSALIVCSVGFTATSIVRFYRQLAIRWARDTYPYEPPIGGTVWPAD